MTNVAYPMRVIVMGVITNDYPIGVIAVRRTAI